MVRTRLQTAGLVAIPAALWLLPVVTSLNAAMKSPPEFLSSAAYAPGAIGRCRAAGDRRHRCGGRARVGATSHGLGRSLSR